MFSLTDDLHFLQNFLSLFLCFIFPPTVKLVLQYVAEIQPGLVFINLVESFDFSLANPIVKCCHVEKKKRLHPSLVSDGG